MRAPEQTSYAGDYDHLARFGEWSLADAPHVEKVGLEKVGLEKGNGHG